MMFTIDGLTWDIPCDIERVSEIKASDISGLMLDRSYFNDVLGTYLQYTIKIAVPLDQRDAYSQIYEAITNPADGHVFVLPYNGTTVTITARVKNISDVYVRLRNNQVYWKGIQFTCISNYPTKALTLGEVITAGRAPLPDVSNPQIGDEYTYTADGWVSTPTYDDADDNYY